MFTEGTTAPAGTTDDLLSPGKGTVDPGTQPMSGSDEEVAKELRAKLSEMGRERQEQSAALQEHRRTIDTLTNLVDKLRTGDKTKTKPNAIEGMDSFISTILDSEKTAEESAAALRDYGAAIAKNAAETATRGFETKLAEQRQSTSVNAVTSYGREFFANKGMPDLAGENSDFFSYIIDGIKGGDRVLAALWNTVESSPQEVFPMVWDRYIKARGVTVKPTAIAEHKEASILSDLPANVVGAASKDALADVRAAAKELGRDLTFQETAEVMAKKGHYDDQKG